MMSESFNMLSNFTTKSSNDYDSFVMSQGSPVKWREDSERGVVE